MAFDRPYMSRRKIQELQSVPCYHQISSFTFRCKFWPQNIFTGNTNSRQEDKCQISQVFTAEVAIPESVLLWRGGRGPLKVKLFEQTCLSFHFLQPPHLEKTEEGSKPRMRSVKCQVDLGLKATSCPGLVAIFLPQKIAQNLCREPENMFAPRTSRASIP